MDQEKAVGIDLGTTNSAVAWIDASGRSAMVPNMEEELLTPSVVLFEDAEVVVGKEARNANTSAPDRVAQWVKRDMGMPVYSRPIRGEQLPPEVIQACILRKLKQGLVKRLGAVGKVVITVPAYFDEPRRKATADAGEMAGLSVLDIVNEPTAAALAFGESAGYLTAGGAPREVMTVLVYDLGGGTFDATLLRLAPGDIRTLATDGDVQLGGYDWDMRLVDHLAEAFQKAHNLDPREDPVALGRLFNQVQEAKHTLSARSRARVQLEYHGLTLNETITREQFEDLTADLLERTAYTTRQLLAEAKLTWKDVTRVLLVGGSTRMPMVERMLREMTSLEPDRTVNPDEAVARGAALYAKYLLSDQPGQPKVGFEVTNVNAHSLGVEGIDPETLRKTNVIMIERNMPLPAKRMEKFVTKTKGQQTIVLQVLQGESSLPGECTAIGRTVIRGLPSDLPQGWPVEVTFEYGTNGLLHITAEVPGTHRQVVLELERDASLSRQGLDRWKQVFSSGAGFDAFESMLDEVLGSAGPAAEPVPVASTPQPALGAEARALPTATLEAPAAEPATQAPLDPTLEENGGPVLPDWVLPVVGYVTSAVVGLGVGWFVLHLLRPNQFPLPW